MYVCVYVVGGGGWTLAHGYVLHEPSVLLVKYYHYYLPTSIPCPVLPAEFSALAAGELGVGSGMT